MKHLYALRDYLYTRYSFYPVFTGFAAASMASFLTRETVWLANGGLGTMTTLSLSMWMIIFAASTIIAFMAPRYLWPLITYAACLIYAFPMMAANHSNVWMLTGALFLVALLTYFVLLDSKALFAETVLLCRCGFPIKSRFSPLPSRW